MSGLFGGHYTLKELNALRREEAAMTRYIGVWILFAHNNGVLTRFGKNRKVLAH